MSSMVETTFFKNDDYFVTDYFSSLCGPFKSNYYHHFFSSDTSATATGSKNGEDFSIGTNVQIIGLKSARQYNGRTGIVKGFTKENNNDNYYCRRYTVEINNTKELINAKAENMAIMTTMTKKKGTATTKDNLKATEDLRTKLLSSGDAITTATVSGLIQRNDLNGKTVHVISFNSKLNRYAVKVLNNMFISSNDDAGGRRDDNTKAKEIMLLKRNNLIFSIGTKMQISNLSSALQFNGMYGSVLKYSIDTDRYTIMLLMSSSSSSNNGNKNSHNDSNRRKINSLVSEEGPTISLKSNNIIAVL